MIDVFKVLADRKTGHWLTDPEWIGETTLIQWNAMQDTQAVHYDTFDCDGMTCAIELHWQH